MLTPIFKNEKPYTVAVPTPYGSTINVPPGHYVTGNYFNAFYARTKELKLVVAGTPIPENRIICSYEVKTTPVQATNSVIVNTTPVPELQTIAVTEEEVKVPDIIAEPPKKNKGGRPRKNLADATNEMWKDVTFILPAASEVDKMSVQQLEKLATKLNVSKSLPRTELIENIKLKLG